MTVEVKGDHVHLNAMCKKTTGEWVPTSTIVYDVEISTETCVTKSRGTTR